MKTKWPKLLPPLTEEQKRIREEFMLLWHQTLPNKYQAIENFNHGYPVRQRVKEHVRTLEVGVGLGAHLEFEDLSDQEYHALELREEWVKKVEQDYPQVQVIPGDCQRRLPYENQWFDRIIAIHVLEHLVDLPSALKEIRRILKSDGQFCAVIPCEGGSLYSFGRLVSAKRIFKKKYNMDYNWLIQSEHVSNAREILEEIKAYFIIQHSTFFPLRVPLIDCNLCIGISMTPK